MLRREELAEENEEGPSKEKEKTQHIHICFSFFFLRS
jgi:hypothetical protein